MVRGRPSQWHREGDEGEETTARGGRRRGELKSRAEFLNKIQQEDRDQFESEANARIQAASDKWEAERWLNRCGWPRYLEGVERDEIRALLQPIGDDEPVLQRMWEIFERVLDEAYTATSRCFPGTAELFEIERREFLDHPFKNGDHYESIIIGALAIMGFDREGGGWVPIRYTTPGTERIDWRGDQIIHGQVRITMGEISDMLHSLTIEARRTLSAVGDIKGGGDEDEEEDDIALPRIPWSKIEDRHGESALGHSFIKDEENQSWITAGEGWTRQQIISSSARYKMFVLMHMLGGQPARSTEILGLRMWNTANGGIRNIFIHEGMVCFVTMYHKGFRQSDSIKVIHRYLPREGRIKKKRRQSAFLWADEVVSEHGGKDGKGGFSKVRAAGISNNDDKAESQSQQEREEEEAAFMDWFREKKWINDRARRALQRYSTQFSSQELNISGWRQMAIGISNRYFNKVFETDDDGDELDEDGNGSFIDSIYDLQAGHGSHIAGLIYARLFGKGELGTIRSREKFRKISMQWHRFFGFGAADRKEQLGGKRIRTGIFDNEREELRRKRFGRLHRIDMKGQLGQMMGPSARFRGLQEPVIRAVARGEWLIVQITPIGGGKSLTFMLPAYCTPNDIPSTTVQNQL
ncbi:hypothetical protein FOXYSP1_20015 [Fusarium oxysporum f. sp. phaseoli]